MSFTREVLMLVFAIAGGNLKLADIYGVKREGYLSAIVSSVCMGLLIAYSSSCSSIILGIIIGVTLAGKVDQLNLMFGLGLTLTNATIFGFIFPDLPLLAMISIISLIDELGHDKFTSIRGIEPFFRFRMSLKIAMIVLTILKYIEAIYTIGVFCFDITYEAIGIIWTFSVKEKQK